MGLLGLGLYLREEVGGAVRTEFRLGFEWVGLGRREWDRVVTEGRKGWG